MRRHWDLRIFIVGAHGRSYIKAGNLHRDIADEVSTQPPDPVTWDKRSNHVHSGRCQFIKFRVAHGEIELVCE
jgi:hypothetical protein